MRDVSSWRVASVASVFGVIMCAAAPAMAQAPATAGFGPAPANAAPAPANAAPAPSTAPAQGTAPATPPPGYAYPPPYPPPPGYAYPPPAYGAYPASLRAPESAPYHGGPVPPGYHVEERARRGLIIGGSLTLGIPWILGLSIASIDNFSNQSGWLIVPALGPWITLAARDKDHVCSYAGSYNNCPEENAVRTFLVLDGLTQTAGAIMLIVGMASPKKVVARDFVSRLQLSPAPIGKLGYGGVLRGEF